ncbi:MAG: hypothetical protein ACRDTF_21750 [Pseudonocardiaceae bacterium]
MSSPDQEREQELAELLREVRALRKTIDQFKASPALQPARPPDYQVLVRSPSALPPDYQVLVRSPQALPPDYAVAVRAQSALPPDYAVAVRSQLPFQVPSYEVLVRPVIPEFEEPPIVEQ